MKSFLLFICISVFLSFGCSDNEEVVTFVAKEEKSEEKIDSLESKTISILSLGDSYTIGQSVCEACRFPEQLKDSLLNSFSLYKKSISVELIRLPSRLTKRDRNEESFLRCSIDIRVSQELSNSSGRGFGTIKKK